MTPRILIAYYSMGGNTHGLAVEIREALAGDADVERIREPRNREGVVGTLGAMLDAVARRQPPIDPILMDPARYDLLFLGGPVWAGRIASPVRTYTSSQGSRAARVAFFCTEGGSGHDGAFMDLARLCGRAPVAVLAIDAQHLEPSRHRDALAGFVSAARVTLQTPAR